jgi:hypothetical protein
MDLDVVGERRWKLDLPIPSGSNSIVGREGSEDRRVTGNLMLLKK